MIQQNCLNKRRLAISLVISLALSVVYLLSLSDISYAVGSDEIALQGKIVRNDTGHEGLNVVTGTPACVLAGADTCDFQVAYYSAASGGTLYLTETFSNAEIGEHGGVFNLKLGSDASPTTTSECSDGTCDSIEEVISEFDVLYIEIRFAPLGASSFTETFTRTTLNASAYAIRSEYAEGSILDSFDFYNSANSTGITTTTGSVYYDTTESALQVYDGSGWVDLGGGDYSDGGEAGGADRTLGNTDAFALSFITSNTERLKIESTGDIDIAHMVKIDGEQTIYNAQAEDGFTGSLIYGNGGANLSHTGFFEGYYNTSVGIDSGVANTTGYFNTAIGAGTFYTNTTGDSNTALGADSLYLNTAGSYNVATGLSSLRSNTTGDYNTATGSLSLYANTTGYSNTATGYQSLENNTTGYRNTVQGQYGLHDVTEGFLNTAIGSATGLGITTGDYNTIIGANVSGLTADLSNNVIIADSAGNIRIQSASTGAITFNGTYTFPTADGTNGQILSTNGSGVLTWGAAGGGDYSDGGEAGGADRTLGNTDAFALSFLTNSVARLKIESTGDIDITQTIKIDGEQTIYNAQAEDNFTGSLIYGNGGANLSHTMLMEGYYNTFLGIGAGFANTTGSANTAIGEDSLYTNTTGYSNTSTGNSSLHFNTVGYGNTATGNSSLYSNTGGDYNTAIGNRALHSNSTGDSNTASGYDSLYSNTTGYYNVASGHNALYDVTEGFQNAAIGYNTGRGITTGDYNTILGANVTGLSADLSNNVIIADSAGNIRIQSSSTGAITFNGAYAFPTSDGTNNQVLTTDGSGALSWSSTAGAASFSDGGEAGGADRTLGNTDAFALSFLTNNLERLKIESGGDIDISQTIKIGGEQTVYNAAAEDGFTGTLVYGNGGTNLSHSAGDEGYYNTFVGINSGLTNTTGYNNTALGISSLRLNTSGYHNVAVGSSSLNSNTTGYFNAAFGYAALSGNTTGMRNTAVGRYTLRDVTEGYDNTAIGYNTGRGITTGDFNTIIGANVIGLSGGLANNVVIADGAGNIRIQVIGSGAITFNGAYTFPTADGTNGQILSTNGSGVLTWGAASSGGEYSDGGEAGTADRTLGNTDAFALSFITNNTERLKIESTGDIDISQTIKIDGEQTIYNAQAEDGFTGSLIFGNGGASLSHSSGSEGYYNTFLGIDSGNANTVGYGNSALGYQALRTNVGNSRSTAVGVNAMQFADDRTVGRTTFNTAIGYEALRGSTTAANNTGQNNTAVGYASLQSNTSGHSNTASGINSLRSNTTGYSNTVSGANSLYSNTTGYSNTVSGVNSLYSNVANSRSTAIGVNSMQYADNRTTGRDTYNTAIGYEALRGSVIAANNTGQYNTAIGDSSLHSNTSGYYNTASGHNALYDVTEGFQNTAIGYNTGRGITTGDYNTILGANVTGLSADLSNNVIIADSQGNIRIQSSSTGAITFNGAYTFPTADGTNGQILSTNGSGVLTWGAAGSGGDYSDGGEAGTADRTLGNTDAYALSFITTNLERLKIESGGDIDIAHMIKIDGEQTIYNAQAEDGFTGSLIYGNGGTNLSYTAGNDAYYNTFIGIGSGVATTTGHSNTTLGYNTLNANTVGDYNIAIGELALAANTSGDSNIAIGSEALYVNTTGEGNTAVGTSSLVDNTTGYDNTAIGFDSLSMNTTGYDNTAVGYYSLGDITEGYDNVALGYGTGGGITTGDYNTILGANVTGLTADLSNNVIIADSEGNIRIQSASTGAITFNGTYTFPTADGTNGQILSTNGSGVLTWGAAGSGGDYSDGGEAGGADRTLGNTDAFALSFITTNLERLKIESGGDIDIAQTIKIDGEQTIYNAQAEDGFTGSLIYGDGGTNLSHTSGSEGYHNTFIGIEAGSATTTGFYNTATGRRALYSNTTGASNTAYGMQSLASNTTGAGNTAIGMNSLLLSTGNSNTAIGSSSLQNNTTGSENVASGYYSLYTNTTGYNNTASGSYSLHGNTTGYYNVASGYHSLRYNTTGYQNTAYGIQSLMNVTEGFQNTAIGYDTGLGITTGDYNTILGANVSGLAADLSNNVIIADSQGNIRIQSASTGAITFNGTYTFPTADGTNGQILSTNGSGVLTWGAAGGGDYSDGGEAGGADRTLGNTDAFALSFITTNLERLKIESGGDIDIAQTIKIDGEQTIYNAQAEDGFTGALIYGNGGTNLSHTSGDEGWYNTFLGIDSGLANTIGYANTAVGYHSLNLNTEGEENTAIGYRSLYTNLDGYQNIALGAFSLFSNTEGAGNVALGYEALYSNTEGLDNIAIGFNSLYANTSGENNVAIGSFSLSANTTGYLNTAIGDSSLENNTTGYDNVAIGNDALGLSTTGIYNTAIGSKALDRNVANSRSTAMGYNAMYYADNRTTGRNTYNTAVGYEALRGSTTAANNTGQYNTAIGDSALFSNTSGYNNTSIGYNVLYDVTEGFQNTAIGYNTGRGITTGDYNTILGANVTGLTADLSNNVIIADSAGNIRIQSASTGAITFNGTYTFPTADGTNGQILSTDGSGALSWYTPSKADYADGGEVGGADRTVGNTDAFALSFLTNNVARFEIESGGDIDIAHMMKIDGEQTIYNAQAEDGFTGSLIFGNGGTNLSHTTGDTGYYNTFLGIDSGLANIRGDGNTASGAFSLYSNTYGRNNTASGAYSLYSNTTASHNTAIGHESMYSNTTGYYNTAVGRETLYFNTTGQYNTAIGNNSLSNNAANHRSTAIGYHAMYYADNRTTGRNTYNIAVGYEALRGSTTAANNTGQYNTAIGDSTLLSNSSGYNNTAVGYQALYDVTTGFQNTAIGYNTGRGITTGDYNTILGANVTGLTADLSNNVIIADGAGNIRIQSASTGAITFNGAYAFPTSDGTNNQVLSTDGSGALSWVSGGAGGDYSDGGEVGGADRTLGNTDAFALSFLTNSVARLKIESTGDIDIAHMVKIDGEQTIYNAQAEDGFTGSLIFGNGGTNLSHSSGLDGWYNTFVGIDSGSANTTGYQNTAMGSQSLGYNTTGYYNIAMGYRSLYANTTGHYNTATGSRSLYANTSGSLNTASGYQSLYVNTTGGSNTATGAYSLLSNTTGSSNTANGYQSLYANTTGYSNTAIGDSSLRSNTTGYQNTATGGGALYSNVANSRSTAIGYSAMYYADDRTTGRDTFNTAVGYQALRGSTTAANNTGQFNTAIGDAALTANTTGNYNTATGLSALTSNTTGGENSAMGHGALYNNTTGIQNTAVGKWAFINNTTGSQNTVLGYNARPSASNQSNSMALGNGATVTASNYVRIGNTSVTQIGGQVIWSNLSDARMKENVIDSDLGLDFIKRLRPVTFNFIEGNEGIEYTGFIAQEVEAALQGIEFSGLNRPANEDDYYSLGYATFVVPLVNAVQELNEQIFGITDQTIYNAQIEDGFTGSLIYGDGGRNLTHTTGSEGYYNTFLGIDSGHANTTGHYNTATGYGSLYDITEGLGNTAMGYNTGRGITTGDNNTVLGANVTGLASDLSNNIILADGEGTIRLQIADTGTMTLTGSLESATNDTYDIGSTATRWKDIYAQGEIEIGDNGDSGNIRYNTTDDRLEFSNDGTNWIPLADRSKTMTISAEYAGSVLASDGTDNTGAMTSDAEGSIASSMNYYQWNSSETSLQDYDIRLRFTLPSDFISWGTNAFTFHYATEANTNTNNKLDFYVYEESSSTVDGSSTDKYSDTAATWTTTTIPGADLGDCNAAGETCLVLIRLYSGNDSYSRVGDIDINYTRAL